MPNYRTRFSQSAGSQRVRAKFFGVGSAGCNIIDGVPFPTVVLSTSSADLARSRAERKVLIGADRLLGVADSSPDLVKQLPSIVGHELFDVFNNTELAFLMCGLGGVSGSLGSRMLCSIARAKGATAIVIAATPFSAESIRRREAATKALAGVLSSSQLVIEFDNDKLSSLAPSLQLHRAFDLLNGIMMRPATDLCAVMSRDDVSSFRQILGESSYGRFGLGLGRGDERVDRAVAEALSSPWFDYDLKEVSAAIAVYSAADPWDKEVEKILSLLEERLPDIRLGWGSYADTSLGDRIRLSLILCKKR